ncbi:hypothetical protein Taro_052810 [Colocasia esculenta]|uniref:Uncharacterized protein n=1 Tax=Colocasia esculenta TaxID=4460 RepID=A0A843XJB8_COLES|nr:hypothetical protein [Colocasia esculenta]
MAKVQGGSSCGPLTWVEVRGGRACVRRSFSCGCSVSLVLLPHVFDSTGSAGVIFGLTRVLVEAFSVPLLYSTLQ